MEWNPTRKYQIHPDMIDIEDVVIKTGKGRSTVYANINPKSPYYDKTFPKPVRTGQKSVRWLVSELDAWILTKAAERKSN